jgi:hypothetical protein
MDERGGGERDVFCVYTASVEIFVCKASYTKGEGRGNWHDNIYMGLRVERK